MSRIVRCRECRHFVGKVVTRIEVIGTVKHSDRADPEHEVFACGSCGTLHEIRRLDTEEAA